ncbi:MAG: DUF2867 domain-containing protein [Acidiferrobacterales bacterium]|nr:DUF2867 domain-containing protein [Acidiferrobacterales bacterium]
MRIGVDPDAQYRVTVTASVKNKNIIGHVYMLPVRPVHELIIYKMLKKLTSHPDVNVTN